MHCWQIRKDLHHIFIKIHKLPRKFGNLPSFMDLLGPALYLASEQHQTIWFQVFPSAKLFAHLSLWWGGHVCAYPQLHLKRLDWPRALCTSHLIIALNIIPTQDIAGYHTHVAGRGGSKADLTYRTIWRITQRSLIAPQHNESLHIQRILQGNWRSAHQAYIVDCLVVRCDVQRFNHYGVFELQINCWT